jgi:hypothetical protein
MRDALRLMVKVFAVVFGAGAAVVVLGYLVLGSLYMYKRIEAPKQTANQPNNEATVDALVKKYGGTLTGVELYDPNSLPDVLPEAQLDCADKNKPWVKARGKGPLCWVEIDQKVAATITVQEAKDNLAGWMAVPDQAAKGFVWDENGKLLSPPCPQNDPLGLNTKSKCAPLPGQKTTQ